MEKLVFYRWFKPKKFCLLCSCLEFHKKNFAFSNDWNENEQTTCPFSKQTWETFTVMFFKFTAFSVDSKKPTSHSWKVIKFCINVVVVINTILIICASKETPGQKAQMSNKCMKKHVRWSVHLRKNSDYSFPFIIWNEECIVLNGRRYTYARGSRIIFSCRGAMNISSRTKSHRFLVSAQLKLAIENLLNR